MTSFVALLRGINVGGHKAVAMADLRELIESSKYVDVRSLLQSGNLVFKSRNADARQIEAQLEKEIAGKFGHSIDCFVRDAADWQVIITGNPFHGEAANDPGHLLVMCLKDEPGSKALDFLRASIVGREFFSAKGRCLYLVYPDGVGRSRLTHALIESKLGMRGTARNWNTVQKIAALMMD